MKTAHLKTKTVHFRMKMVNMLASNCPTYLKRYFRSNAIEHTPSLLWSPQTWVIEPGITLCYSRSASYQDREKLCSSGKKYK